jgi:hypothetical protein
MKNLPPIKFTPGEVILSDAMWQYFQGGRKQRAEIFEFLYQHLTGEWGLVCQEVASANDAALSEPNGMRILSKYIRADGQEMYVVTSWDKTVTTVTLVSEY